jgi:hypothetical protein
MGERNSWRVAAVLAAVAALIYIVATLLGASPPIAVLIAVVVALLGGNVFLRTRGGPR